MNLLKNKYFGFITFGISIAVFLAVLLFDVSANPRTIVKKASNADPSANETLLAWARSDRVRERELAATYLWRYKDNESFKMLASLANDPYTAVRAKAYNSLSFSRESSSIAVLNAALKNKKLPRHEKALINLLKTRGIKSVGLDIHIKNALEHFSLKGRGMTPLSTHLIQALLAVPHGRENLKTLYEKLDPKKITDKTATLTIAGVSASCPSNRFEYFKNALITLEGGSNLKEQIQALSELKRHGAKGAEILGSFIGKESKVPENIKESMNNYISQNSFQDRCERTIRTQKALPKANLKK